MVRNGNAHRSVCGRDVNRHRIALRVINGIGQKVAQDALEAAGIGLDTDALLRQIELDLHVELAGQMLHLPVGRLHTRAQINGCRRQVRHTSIVARNLQQVREQFLEAVELARHEAGSALGTVRQAIAFRLNHVRGHAHGGQWGAQLMGDVRSKLPLQIAVLLQLRNLGGKLIGHVIEGRGQATHLIITIDGHALLQMTRRQALCDA